MKYLMGQGKDVVKFFEAFDIDVDGLYEATIRIKAGDIVTVETKGYLKKPNLDQLNSVMRKYRLKLISEKTDAPPPPPIWGPGIVLGDNFGRGI